MDNGYILDTNCVIYLLNRDPNVTKELLSLKEEGFFISTVTYFEVLNGNKNRKEFRELEKLLSRFIPMAFTWEVAKVAAKLDTQTKHKKKFKDLFIAATAMQEKLTLITADSDFKNIKGLTVKWIKPKV